MKDSATVSTKGSSSSSTSSSAAAATAAGATAVRANGEDSIKGEEDKNRSIDNGSDGGGGRREGKQKSEVEELAEREYEARIEDEYAKREGGA